MRKDAYKKSTSKNGRFSPNINDKLSNQIRFVAKCKNMSATKYLESVMSDAIKRDMQEIDKDMFIEYMQGDLRL